MLDNMSYGTFLAGGRRLLYRRLPVEGKGGLLHLRSGLKWCKEVIGRTGNPDHVEVEICRADELSQRRELNSELDEMWSFVVRRIGLIEERG